MSSPSADLELQSPVDGGSEKCFDVSMTWSRVAWWVLSASLWSVWAVCGLALWRHWDTIPAPALIALSALLAEQTIRGLRRRHQARKRTEADERGADASRPMV
jgi:hypothetical protein